MDFWLNTEWISVFYGYEKGRTNRKATSQTQTSAVKLSVLLGVLWSHTGVANAKPCWGLYFWEEEIINCQRCAWLGVNQCLSEWLWDSNDWVKSWTSEVSVLSFFALCSWPYHSKLSSQTLGADGWWKECNIEKVFLSPEQSTTYAYENISMLSIFSLIQGHFL